MRNAIVPGGRLAEHLAGLPVDPKRVLYRNVGGGLNFDLEVKVFPSIAAADRVLHKEASKPHHPRHWRACIKRPWQPGYKAPTTRTE